MEQCHKKIEAVSPHPAEQTERRCAPISTSPAQQSQSTCKTQGPPELVTGYDNVCSDVCSQEFSSKDALKIHMESHER